MPVCCTSCSDVAFASGLTSAKGCGISGNPCWQNLARRRLGTVNVLARRAVRNCATHSRDRQAKRVYLINDRSDQNRRVPHLNQADPTWGDGLLIHPDLFALTRLFLSPACSAVPSLGVYSSAKVQQERTLSSARSDTPTPSLN